MKKLKHKVGDSITVKKCHIKEGDEWLIGETGKVIFIDKDDDDLPYLVEFPFSVKERWSSKSYFSLIERGGYTGDADLSNCWWLSKGDEDD
jgi:hypothetical protein